MSARNGRRSDVEQPASEGHAEALPASVPAVRVHGVNFFFGEEEARNQVLFDIDLEVMPGEIVILTGPSGSGKTTLLTLIGGLRTLQEGDVAVCGQELRGLGSEQLVRARRRIGFIFQKHNLLEALTAYQNVKTATALTDLGATEAHERIVTLLTRFGLDQRMHYKPAKLSGGQRQRVAVARAVVNRPRLILADEPTAALDAEAGRNVVSYLQELARGEQRCTSLIVTHDNRILDVADRIITMIDGRLRSNVRVTEAVVARLFLGRCEVFAGLPPEALAKVASRMSREGHPAGARIVRQGQEGDKFYLIRHGSVDVIVDHGEPAERMVARLGAGDFFGEAALLREAPRDATVVARESVEVYALSKADFNDALASSKAFREQVLKVHSQRG